MKPWQINTIIYIILIILIFLPVSDESASIMTSIIAIIVLGTTIWVYIDAKKLNIGNYKPTLFGRGPISYALTTNIFWIIGLPFYISHRQKIINGKFPLKK